MTKQELHIKVALFQRELADLNRIKVRCNTCEHFTERIKRCDKHQACPPDEVISAGCDDWVYDPIPF